MGNEPESDPYSNPECWVCESGELVSADAEKVCDNCHFVPDFTGPSRDVGTWERWWQHREAEYEGFYGSERVRMPGGFAYPYL